MNIKGSSTVAAFAIFSVAVIGAVAHQQYAQHYVSQNESVLVLCPPASRGTSQSQLGVLEFQHTLVKDVPVSASVAIEHVEKSAEGDTTVRTVGKLYRDAEGRTRYDEMRETKGQDESVVEELLKTTINDPAAGVSLIVDPKRNTAYRKSFFAQPEPGAVESRDLPAQRGATAKQGSLNSQILPVPTTIDMNQGLKSAHSTASGSAKHESLGRREIEGMLADGTRIVMTVPAGSMQNEKQIEIGCERWYSPSLKTWILIECSDSRSGTSSYRLTQIKTDPPPANLFKLPNDTKIRE